MNLSITGCGLHAGKYLKDHSYVHVFLFLPDYDLPLKMPAAVRWKNDNTYGLEFIRMRQDQQKRLQEFLSFLDRKAVQ